MSVRELQKAARRRVILDAARALILEGGRGDFSMAALAEAAGVSLVTPYNLFGSKAKILLEIAREGIFGRMTSIADLPCESLAQFLADLSAMLAKVYYEDRQFYRRMVATMSAQSSAVLRLVGHCWTAMNLSINESARDTGPRLVIRRAAAHPSSR